MPTNLFLKFEPEIKGESSHKGYEGQIEVMDYRFGVSQTGGFSFAQGGTRVQSHLEDLTVSFRMCSASPKLMQYCATGKHLSKATLTATRAAGGTLARYLEVVLTDVVVSSYRTGAGNEQDIAHDVISLNFAKIDQEYFAVN